VSLVATEARDKADAIIGHNITKSRPDVLVFNCPRHADTTEIVTRLVSQTLHQAYESNSYEQQHSQTHAQSFFRICRLMEAPQNEATRIVATDER
jgi:hypothetical protein